MKKVSLISLFILISTLLFGQAVEVDRPVAVIKLHKTEVLPQSKYIRYENTMKLQKQGVELSQDEKVQLLDVLINQILVRQDAETLGIAVSDEEVLPAAMEGLSMELQQLGQIPAGAVLTDPAQFRALLEQNGHDYDLYIENAKNSLLIEKYITETRRDDFMNMPGPDDEAIEGFYNQNIAQFAQPEYVLISQIFFSLGEGSDKTAVKAKAEDLYRKISGGQLNFDEVVKEEGDNFPFTQVKGQPFTVAKADGQAAQYFGESFTDALFADKEISRVYLLESNVGFHIVRLDQHKEAGVLKLDDRITPMQEITVRDYLSRMIYSQMQQELYAKLQMEVVLDLREKSEVKTFEDAL
ncbi:MAG: peptidyl-prolyl cis-trans isomerase [Spirochaetales bacterium]|nr:peptidyl-prolyl cis-trans isomerase [Spirochaetales bacterium]